MTDEERFIYNHGYGQAKRDFIKELEKIKADLLNLEFNFHYDWFTTKHIIEIIDNHIKELKGE